MLHQPLETEQAPARRPARAPKRRRVFGWREIVLVVIAFLLLALLPSSAQWAWSLPAETVKPDPLAYSAERPAENFSGSAFYFLDPDIDAPAAEQLKPAKPAATEPAVIGAPVAQW